MCFIAVNEVEGERKFVPHFVSPLQTQRGGCEHKDTLHAAAQQEFGENQPGFNCFAEAHIVCQQQVDAWHTQRLEQWHKLKVIHLHCAMKGAEQGQTIERAGPVGVDKGRCCRPAGCAQQCIVVFGGHRVAAGNVGQGCGFQQAACGFKFPDKLFTAWQLVVFVLNADEVQPSGGCIEGFDAGSEATSVADDSKHADTG